MYLTVKEVAGILRVSQRQTYNYLHDGLIPHVKIKGKYLINEESFKKVLKDMERKKED
ncbi:helix-turn-helix domain-containing protein [Macrococcoides bohemicum]|uniref:helix-turn-helix domain-containing protein n=1 Tax=Macrococcoides bohemicum TaxID=1903056 RepID=UPI000BB550B4|nr:helix-turn-helix domain-containing protein [Macrococcus sp. IME1552]